MQGHSFGYWLKLRRKALDLTQAELASQVSCSAAAIRKIEAEERRPSVQIAKRLAEIFNIPQSEQKNFLRFARGELRSVPAETKEDFPWHASTKTTRSNLPATVTSLIGRERKIADIREYLMRADVRLVTLIGPPGIGKTRLSIEAARASLNDFPDGVFFVPMAPLEDSSLIAPTIIQALGYVEAKDQSASQQLVDGVGNKQMLLVLDNCEHLIEEIARLASSLLSACSRFKILTTSREALRISGEWLYSVPSLDVPKDSSSMDVGTASEFPALTLFAERARAVRSDFALDANNVQTVASICTKLDGLPLAIELMAARIRFMSPETLLDRWSDQFLLSADGMRAVSARQKTLHDAIAWSYNLLTGEEQKLFAHLSVFSGGFALETAEAVFSQIVAGKSISDLIASLLDKSLLQRISDERGEPRFNMLVTVQQFALHQLRSMGKEAEARDRHLACFGQLAAQAKLHLRSAEQLLWLDRLETEFDNIRAALNWAHGSGAVVAGLGLVADLEMFWIYRAHLREPYRAFENLAAHPVPDDQIQVLARAHNVAGHLQMFLGNNSLGHAHARESERLCLQLRPIDKADLAEVRNLLIYTDLNVANDPIRTQQRHKQNLKLFQEAGDQWGIAHTIFNIGQVLRRIGDLPGARQAFERSLALFRECGDNLRVRHQKAQLAFIAFDEGKYAEAGTRLEEVLSFYRQVHYNIEIDVLLYLLGVIAIREKDHERAKAWYSECLLFVQQIGRNWQLVECLIGFAAIAYAEKHFKRAVRLLGAAEAEIEKRKIHLEKHDQAELQRLIAVLREEFGTAKFEGFANEGRAMTLEQAVAYALEDLAS